MNLGRTDRMLRILLGAAIAFWFVGRERHQWLALAGVVPMATGWLGWCPLYQLFGLHTDGPVRTNLEKSRPGERLP